jgi:ATP citrate (pro-S)-lyase
VHIYRPECTNSNAGAPSEVHTYDYAKIILSLTTKHADIKNKVLLIGGGIANFTDVADTFKGIVRAIREFADKLRQQQIRIYVRRGGPNFQEGLNMMRQLGVDLDLPIVVHGPEHHMTEIVSLALNVSNDEHNESKSREKKDRKNLLCFQLFCLFYLLS